MSHGTQVCPGYGLSIFLGQAVLAHLIDRGTPEVSGTRLDPTKPLPYSLDPYGFRVDMKPLS